MLHRSKPPYTIRELQKAIEAQRNKLSLIDVPDPPAVLEDPLSGVQFIAGAGNYTQQKAMQATWSIRAVPDL
ncbi:MAG: hypothetical protein R3F19_16530 [Verrucomicrobiales bacterium]